MNDAQTWTLIVGFFTLLIASQALVLRVVRTEIRALRAEFEAALARLSEQIRVEIAELRGELKAAVARIDAHLERLERDR